MLLFRPMLLAAAVTTLAGCSLGEPFVDRDFTNVTVSKPKLPGHNGLVMVCYGSDTPLARRNELAAQACAEWGLSAVLTLDQPWQCRLTVPHLATYACIDPAMRLDNGTYVNPYNAGQVEAWRNSRRDKPAAPSPASPDKPL
jgi:hypothetical protein